MTEGETYHPVPDFPSIDIKQLEFIKNIERSKSCVYLYRHKETNENLAVKEYTVTNLPESEIQRKIDILRRVSLLKHPNIVQYKGLMRYVRQSPTSRDKTLVIFMDQASKNLYELINDRNNRKEYFNLEEIMVFIGQMINALEKLEQIGIAHRDIKPQNILVEDDVYKLCDFEDSIDIKQENIESNLNMSTFQFSPLAMIHEFKQQRKMAFDPFKADVFSLGITVLFMSSLGKFTPLQRIPYTTDKESHQHFLKQQRKAFIKQRYANSHLNRLMKMMLQDDEYKRETFQSLRIKMEYMQPGSYSHYSKSDNSSTSASSKKTSQSKPMKENQPAKIPWGFFVRVIVLFTCLILLCIF